MRKSKSNPAKCARNYWSISQRHITGHHGPDGGATTTTTNKSSKLIEKELQTLNNEEQCLAAILSQSESTWKRGLAQDELHNDE